MHDVRVRDAKPDDAEAIAGIHIDAWRIAYRGLMPDDVLDGLSVEGCHKRWRGTLEDPRRNGVTLVAERAGHAAGFASYGHSRDTDAQQHTWELWALYVRPNRWGTGVGRALLFECQERACRAGATRLTLWVLDGNERAKRFYEAAGFVADGQKRLDEHPKMVVEQARYVRSLGIRH